MSEHVLVWGLAWTATFEVKRPRLPLNWWPVERYRQPQSWDLFKIGLFFPCIKSPEIMAFNAHQRHPLFNSFIKKECRIFGLTFANTCSNLTRQKWLNQIFGMAVIPFLCRGVFWVGTFLLYLIILHCIQFVLHSKHVRNVNCSPILIWQQWTYYWTKR